MPVSEFHGHVAAVALRAEHRAERAGGEQEAQAQEVLRRAAERTA